MSEASRAPGRTPQGRIGTVVNGKWQIDARIGSGGMATVYAATHRNGHRAALKMLHAALSRDEATRARFLREGYVANAVGHPGVVRVEDDGITEDGAAFLVLDLLEGETLEARRMRFGGVLPVDEAVAIADQALDALGAAHEKGIIHRDVKPENVFLTTKGEVKLFDFGLARMKDFQVGATKTGVTIGTPAYMPPEQALGKRDEVDARSDVWGLGATLFTVLTGKYVHDADSLHDQLVASATRRARPVRELAPHVSEAVGDVIDRALELARTDRWESAREMQRALRAARVPRTEASPVVAESLTLRAKAPREAPGAEKLPESGPQPSAQGPDPASDRTVDMGVPASDPTIEQPVIVLEGLPTSGGPMTPPPHTERLVAPRAANASTPIQPGPQTPRTNESLGIRPLLASTGTNPLAPPLASTAANALAPTLASTGNNPLALSASGSNPQLGGGGSNPQLSGSGSNPQLGQSGSNPQLSGTGSNPHALSASGSNPQVQATGSDPGLVGRAGGGQGRQPSIAAAPPVTPPGVAPPTSTRGPLSLRQRRSARVVVVVSLLLIVVCAAAGVWVLLHGSLSVPR